MSTSDFVCFIHYDSRSAALSDEKTMPLATPADGIYWISMGYISLKFPDAYTPDKYTGFLVISDTEEIQPSSTCVVGVSTRGKIFFPLNKPDDANPTCKTYAKIRLRQKDKLSVSYYDNSFTKKAMDQITVTLHLSNNVSIIK